MEHNAHARSPRNVIRGRSRTQQVHNPGIRTILHKALYFRCHLFRRSFITRHESSENSARLFGAAFATTVQRSALLISTWSSRRPKEIGEKIPPRSRSRSARRFSRSIFFPTRIARDSTVELFFRCGGWLRLLSYASLLLLREGVCTRHHTTRTLISINKYSHRLAHELQKETEREGGRTGIHRENWALHEGSPVRSVRFMLSSPRHTRLGRRRQRTASATNSCTESKMPIDTADLVSRRECMSMDGSKFRKWCARILQRLAASAIESDGRW